jgi:hypothetical protein
MYLKTPIVAEKLGVTYHQLASLIRYGKMAKPQRDSSGDFVWMQADFERARVALSKIRHRKAVAE